MKRLLINATQPDEMRVAITDDALLIDLDIEHPGQEQKKANIYKGCITSIEPSLGAVFVNYGSERHGFLPLKEVSREYFLTDVDNPEDIDIRKVLKEGQELVVQVEKEERGTKGAALTTFISLAGSYLVLMPNNPRAGGISRRIEGEERDQLKDTIAQLDLPEGMGIIIRTAGVDKSTDELKWDLSVLLRFWEAIKKAAISKPGPYLIHQESDVIIRAIRDYLRQDVEEIIVDETSVFERAKSYLEQVRPDFSSRLKLYSDHLPLFSRFQIEQQIEEAHQSELRLPSGGSIVIDNTEALIAIDINSARATKGGNIEETAYNTNLEAADEIARQLRIRDIGGLIVIDFIDMLSTKNQRNIENRLREALRFDRARIQIGRISRFGLLEMSRQRLRSALSVSTQIICPRCQGHGTIRGVESTALSIIHLIQEHAARSQNAVIQVQLPVDVATYLLNEKRNVIKNIEGHSQIEIVIIPNTHLVSPQYQIKEIKDEHSKNIPSYRLAKMPKVEAPTTKSSHTKKHVEPAITQYLTTHIGTAPRKASGGMVKRLWQIMFGPDEPSSKTKHTEKSHHRGHHHKHRHQHGSGQQSPAREGSSDQQHSRGKSTARRGSRGGSRRSGSSSGGQHRDSQRQHPSSKNQKFHQNKESGQQHQTHRPESQHHKPTPTEAPTEIQKPVEHEKMRPQQAVEHEYKPVKKDEPKMQQVTTKTDEQDKN